MRSAILLPFVCAFASSQTKSPKASTLLFTPPQSGVLHHASSPTLLGSSTCAYDKPHADHVNVPENVRSEPSRRDFTAMDETEHFLTACLENDLPTVLDLLRNG